jgi:predicted nucleic acid-binding protein
VADALNGLGGEDVLLADKSAWERSGHPTVLEGWRQALRTQRICSCMVVRYELLYSARDASEFSATESYLSLLRDIPVTISVQRAALGAMRALAERGLHRVPLPDLLVAAAAESAGLDVVHYDRHFDVLTEVLDFGSRWLAPSGTLG